MNRSTLSTDSVAVVSMLDTAIADSVTDGSR